MERIAPEHAFILAAGQGTRMRPHTDDKPKPMVTINNKPILEHTLEKLENAGVKNVTINLYYLGDRIEKHFKDRQAPVITFSHETELLETGGGVKFGLHTMADKPFYLINGDAFWDDTEELSALDQLAEAWDPDTMNILLLLQPASQMSSTKDVGDYNMTKDGRLTRTDDGSGQYIFTGIRITKPSALDNTPEGAFSFLECMDKAQEAGTLYGIEYKGEWHHISTPEDLDRVNEAFSNPINVQEKEA